MTLCILISQGKLKEWSLVLYGTSVQPYSPTNEFPKVERVRNSRVEDPTEDYGAEDYAGELGVKGLTAQGERAQASPPNGIAEYRTCSPSSTYVLPPFLSL